MQGVEIDGKAYVQFTATVGLITVVWNVEPHMARSLANAFKDVAAQIERKQLLVPGGIVKPS